MKNEHIKKNTSNGHNFFLKNPPLIMNIEDKIISDNPPPPKQNLWPKKKDITLLIAS